MDPLEIVLRRFREQRLTGEPFDSPAAVVGWLVGMQAQEFAEAKWSIAERLGGATEAEIDAAFDRGASCAPTCCARPGISSPRPTSAGC